MKCDVRLLVVIISMMVLVCFAALTKCELDEAKAKCRSKCLNGKTPVLVEGRCTCLEESK